MAKRTVDRRRRRDAECLKAVENPNMMVPWYLMASYLYYDQDEALLLDGTFDVMCRRLDAEWDAVEHFHKHLIDREALAAGTCLMDWSKCPQRIKAAAWNAFLAP